MINKSVLLAFIFSTYLAYGLDAGEFTSAITEGNVQKVKSLLRSGVDVNSKNYYGVTALHRAVYDCQNKIVKVLLDNGANVNAKTTSRTTVLETAADATKNSISCVHGPGRDPLQIIQLLLARGAKINKADKEENTVLHRVVGRGLVDAVRLFLESGTNVNVINNMGETPLHFTCMFGYEVNVEEIRLLCAYGANVGAREEYGNTVLHFAAYNGYLDAVRVLVEECGAGELVQSGGRHDLTPRQWAQIGRHDDVAEYLSQVEAGQ